MTTSVTTPDAEHPDKYEVTWDTASNCWAIEKTIWLPERPASGGVMRRDAQHAGYYTDGLDGHYATRQEAEAALPVAPASRPKGQPDPFLEDCPHCGANPRQPCDWNGRRSTEIFHDLRKERAYARQGGKPRYEGIQYRPGPHRSMVVGVWDHQLKTFVPTGQLPGEPSLLDVYHARQVAKAMNEALAAQPAPEPEPTPPPAQSTSYWRWFCANADCTMAQKTVSPLTASRECEGCHQPLRRERATEKSNQ